MTNISSMFNTSVRIQNLDCLDKEAVWPHSVEIAICRIPIRKRDGYDSLKIEKMAMKLKDHLVPNGIVYFICYAPTEAKARPFEIASIMVKNGFTHVDNLIVEKTWFPGKRSEVNLVNSHEYVLYFCNGAVWKLDRQPVRDYLATPDEVTCPGNLWKIKTGSLDESYPLDLAELLIKMSDCLPGSTVLDLYMGTRASLVASLKCGHSFFGFEKDQKKLKTYQKIIDEFKETDTIKEY